MRKAFTKKSSRIGIPIEIPSAPHSPPRIKQTYNRRQKKKIEEMRQKSANSSNTPISLEPTTSRKRNFDDLDDSDNNNDTSSTFFKPINRIKEKIRSLAKPKPSSSQHITIDLATDSGENEDVGESTTSLPEHHIKRRRFKQQRQDNVVIAIEKLDDKEPFLNERTRNKSQETYEIFDDSSDEEKRIRKRKAAELSDNLLDKEEKKTNQLSSNKEKRICQRKAAKLSDKEISFEEKRAEQMALNKEKCRRKRKADELSDEEIFFEEKKANQIASNKETLKKKLKSSHDSFNKKAIVKKSHKASESSSDEEHDQLSEEYNEQEYTPSAVSIMKPSMPSISSHMKYKDQQMSKPSYTQNIISKMKPSSFSIHPPSRTAQDEHVKTFKPSSPYKLLSRLRQRTSIPSEETETKEAVEDYLLKEKDTKFFGRDKHILMYPFTTSKQHSVYWEDIERLKKDRFLNDTIINIYPRIWQDEYPNNKIYVYTSFFFTKLKESKTPEELSNLSRWTQGVNLFEKDLLIIPVAEHSHWFLVLVANPGACIGSSTITDNHFENGKLDKQKSYIMVIDSLGGTQRHVRESITKYLKAEAKKKYNIDESSFIAPQFVRVESPIQDNHYDCGVYCLYTIKQIYENNTKIMSQIYQKKSILDDEQGEAAKKFRVILYKYMAGKVKEYEKFKSS
ncbi:hypothetical protein G6F57_011824 [Rhizopus arrhizus]|uniref:Ubiquitin-like protease family profile domain-containing protein n=1 Tax=Rhizopus oryzae TaxID=64495 RepID=A0A9P6WZZ3_RHIOR|nr:hypothetical protein G6F24_011543 [Rhizopus arrhizus]KAG1407495.1 hypothetical protein G6F58_009648 [Rhizopus delemar]KAG0945235.1 hypothetical protein G6F30_004341 [Rhizopus arrhizus]KAG0980870.1 hypothetical protein G6F28_011546 [Rhizopus arrhizus]KAG0989578.1 hypothetical protein G6F29_000866 [Rhizopus arrhizus]